MVASDAITFYVEGTSANGGLLTAMELGVLFNEWASALEATAEAIRTADRPVRWVISRAEAASFTSVCTPLAESPSECDDANETARLLITAMNQGAQGADVASILPPRAAKHMAQFLQLVKENGYPVVSASTGELSAHITGVALPPAPRLVSYRAPSSVEGTLLSVSYAASNPSFSVRLRLTGQLVTCYFGMELASQVEAALRKRVAVRGMVTYRGDGEPTSVSAVERLYVFPEAEMLPSVDDMVGIEPDLTGGAPSEVWLRQRRA